MLSKQKAVSLSTFILLMYPVRVYISIGPAINISKLYLLTFYLLFYFLQLIRDMLDLLDGEGKTLDQVSLKLLPTQGECTLVLNNTSQLLGAEKHPVKIFPVFYQRFLKSFSIRIIISFNPLVSRQSHKEGEEANWSHQSAG